MKKFSESLGDYANNVIDSEKKKKLPLTKEEVKSHHDAKICYICGKRILKKFADDKYYRKVRDNCHFTDKHRDAAHSICNLNLNLPKEIPVILYNGLNYDYHFIITINNLYVLGKTQKSIKLFPFQ